jgi:hypothetical protein
MEIWSKSQHIESTNRLISSQPQSRCQTVTIPFQEKASLSPVGYGELLITVLKGNGFIKTKGEKGVIEQGDQVYLIEGDEFVLLAAEQDVPLIVQIYWAPQIELHS